MQFQSNVLNTNIKRPKNIETTVMGAAYFAGLAVGFWKDIDEIKKVWQSDTNFYPNKNRAIYKKGIIGWRKAVDALQYYSKL